MTDPSPPPCAGKTELFFPESMTRRNVARARAYCDLCPAQHRLPCAAQGRHEEHGIWAGVPRSRHRRGRGEL